MSISWINSPACSAGQTAGILETQAYPGEADSLQSLVEALGLPIDSQCWQDYEAGKHILAEMGLVGTDFEQALRLLAEYVGV